MMAEKFTQPPMRRTALAATRARLMSQPSFDRLRGTPLLERCADRNAMLRNRPRFESGGRFRVAGPV